MQADEWGEPAWKYLHSVTFCYPIEPTSDDRKYFKELFGALRFTLPCPHCRVSFTELFKFMDIDPYLDTRDGLVFWLFMIHNVVNKKLSRTLVCLNEVLWKYENFRARCGDMNKVIEYNECKSKLKPLDRTEIDIRAVEIHKKYSPIAKVQLKKFYLSDKNVDPMFVECKLSK